MLPWSKKLTKSVTFNPEVADESLLAVVDTELAKQPQTTFSDLCKQALWQYLCIPESVRPNPNKAQNQQLVTELQGKLAEFEERLLAREQGRLEAMEFKLNQLTQQIGQLNLTISQQSYSIHPVHLAQEVEEVPYPPQEVDPLLSRLSAFLDDF
jgi:hypothetical protein